VDHAEVTDVVAHDQMLEQLLIRSRDRASRSDDHRGEAANSVLDLDSVERFDDLGRP